MSAVAHSLGRLLVGGCLVLAIALAGSPASASKPAEGPPWLKLDRVVAEPSWIDGLARLRVYVSAIKLEGGTIDIFGGKEWTLQVGSSKQRLPYLASSFRGVADDVAITFVICISSGFSEELPAIKDAVRKLIDSLPKTAQVAVIGYGEDIDGDRRVGSAKQALATLDEIEAELVPHDPELVKAVTRAVRTFRKAEPSEPGRGLRRMMVVISDGLDIDHEPSRFRSAARRANREEIRIHTVAYSRFDQRRPMLGLAELSKQTHGTFRLARTSQSFTGMLDQLREEIERQYVLTFYVPTDQIEGKRMRVMARDMESNQVKVSDLSCGAESCSSGQYCAAGTCLDRPIDEGRGILGWILVIGGSLLGLLLVLVGIGFVVTRRQEKKAAAAALWAAAAEVEQNQPDPSSNRIVPQGPQGGRVAPAQPRQSAVAPAAAPMAGGRIQPAAPAGQQPAGAAPAVGRVSTLYVLKGAHQGKNIPIRHGFRIGKAPDCDLVLTDDGFASGHHAHIEIDKGGNAQLVDEGSTNGTFVNGVRATRTRLLHGMLIRVGQTELRYMQG